MLKYMITDGNGTYIRRDDRNRYLPVNRQGLGTSWETRAKASNILKSCINKNLRSRYRVEEYEEDTEPEFVPQPSDPAAIDSNKVVPKTEAAKRISKQEIDPGKIGDFEEQLNRILDITKSAEERIAYLEQSLSDVNAEITDIYHYIEFGKFNAYQGWLAFSMLQNRLRQRRKLKDEISILSQLGKCAVNTETINGLKNTIDEMNARKYKPRRLTELFE